MTTLQDDEPSYIDYDTFLDPDFRPSSFANTLVLATNNANDATLDLSTPLSKVLFDAQEIDSHIDLLTSRAAIPLLTHTQEQTEASARIISDMDAQVHSLDESYRQLEKEVIQKHAEADEVRLVAMRLWETLRLGRAVGRCLQLGRQLEVQHAEISSGPTASTRKDDHRALVRCAHTILSLRDLLDKRRPGEEGHGLDRVNAIRGLQDSVMAPIERSVRVSSEQIVREFTMGSATGTATFAQSEETKARTVSALVTLYLISPVGARSERWTPTLMLQSLDNYLKAALSSSVNTLASSLATLPSLPRTLAEIAMRCQNIVALEIILDGTKAPPHPLVPQQHRQSVDKSNLLQPLLVHWETGSLASYFWRSMATGLSPRVVELMNRAGVSARTLRTNRNNVGDAIRDCVLKGSQPPSAVAAAKAKSTKVDIDKGGGWDREVAVMVSSVVGNIGR